MNPKAFLSLNVVPKEDHDKLVEFKLAFEDHLKYLGTEDMAYLIDNYIRIFGNKPVTIYDHGN